MERIVGRLRALPTNVRGIFLMTFSAACYAVMVAIVRGLAQDIHFTEIVFFRLGLGLVAMLPMFVGGGLAGMKTTRIGRYSYRAALQAAAMACYYLGLGILPLAVGVSLYQLTQIFIAVIAI